MTIRITTKLESETLSLPELRPLVGKTVEIWLREVKADVPTLEEVRAILAKVPGSLSADVIADREERF